MTQHNPLWIGKPHKLLKIFFIDLLRIDVKLRMQPPGIVGDASNRIRPPGDLGADQIDPFS